MPLFFIQSPSNFHTIYTIIFQILLLVNIFLTLLHLSLRLITILFLFLTSCLMHGLIFNSITFTILHNIYNYILNPFVSLHFSHTALLILAFYNNFVFIFLTACSMHVLIYHSIHLKISHSIHNYISNPFVSLHFSYTASFILASHNNISLSLNFLSHACPYF